MGIRILMASTVMAVGLALAGCNSGSSGGGGIFASGAAAEANPGPCPRAFALYDASRIVEFKGDGAERFANVGFTGEINNVRSLCRYFSEQPINADLEMDIAFGRGPAASGNTATYEYFVAVTRKNIAVINKQIFPLTVTFPAGADRVSLTETVDRIIIPRANESTSGENFEIVIGFVVTDEQRAFNEQGKRFRVSAGQN